MLEHAPVRAAQDVLEVLALVGAHARDVRVQARLPAAVAEPAAELDEELAVVRCAALEAAVEPRLAADALEVAAHAVEVERWARDQEDLRLCLVQPGVLAGGAFDLKHDGRELTRRAGRNGRARR